MEKTGLFKAKTQQKNKDVYNRLEDIKKRLPLGKVYEILEMRDEGKK